MFYIWLFLFLTTTVIILIEFIAFKIVISRKKKINKEENSTNDENSINSKFLNYSNKENFTNDKYVKKFSENYGDNYKDNIPVFSKQADPKYGPVKNEHTGKILKTNGNSKQDFKENYGDNYEYNIPFFPKESNPKYGPGKNEHNGPILKTNRTSKQDFKVIPTAPSPQKNYGDNYKDNIPVFTKQDNPKYIPTKNTQTGTIGKNNGTSKQDFKSIPTKPLQKIIPTAPSPQKNYGDNYKDNIPVFTKQDNPKYIPTKNPQTGTIRKTKGTSKQDFKVIPTAPSPQIIPTELLPQIIPTEPLPQNKISIIPDDVSIINQNNYPSTTDLGIVQIIKKLSINLDEESKFGNVLILEYSDIKSDIKPTREALKEINKKKNLFDYNFPFDDNRVKLPTDGNDYINASYINNKMFIAAQEPFAETEKDFWKMVWQEKCKYICMLSDVNDQPGTYNYFPLTSSDSKFIYDDMQIKFIVEKKDGNLIERVFHIIQGEDKRAVKQYHLTQIDETKFTSVSLFYEFYKEYFANIDFKKAPCVIHCKDGVGKTGILIAVHDILTSERYQDLTEYITKLRSCRMNMIYSLQQFTFLHGVIAEGLSHRFLLGAPDGFPEILKKHGPAITSSLVDIYKAMIRLEQFGVPKVTNDIVPVKVSKLDRDATRRPIDNFIPKMPNGQYINATLIQNCKKENTYITTQCPMEDTQQTFWQMVYEHKCYAVVTLQELDNERYWPQNTRTKNYGNLIVKHIESLRFAAKRLIVSNLEIIQDKKDEESLIVRHIRLPSWAKDSEFPSPADMLDLIEELRYRQYRNRGSCAVLQCEFGFERCGLVACLMHCFNKMMSDNIVDVYGAVRDIRKFNPLFIPRYTQYLYIIGTLELYLMKKTIK